MLNKVKAIEYLKSGKNIKEVENLLEEASKAYYNSDNLILSDKDYDEIYNLYNKVTGRTIYGASVEGKGTINIKHSYENLVGTLFKLFNVDEMEEFVDEMTSIKVNGYSQILISLKFDGNSVTIEYDKDGKVLKALTRGRNGEGKDLTHVFKNRKINKSLVEKYDSEFAIKYEAIINYENYDKLCKETGEDYANPRSTISGILGRDNAKIYEKYIILVPLEVKFKEKGYENINVREFFIRVFGEENYFSKYSAHHIVGKKVIFNIINEYYHNIINIRSKLPFMIDGIVIEFLNEEYKNLGYTSLSDGSRPRFKKALKLPYLEETTTVTGIEYFYGDTGRITPVVTFKPVKFLGNVQKQQNIHNYKRFKELNLGIGSEILLTYRSDCLSYVNKIDSDYNKKIKPFKFIENCPICGSSLKIITNDKGEETFIECVNPECDGKILGKLTNYLTKMDIKGIKENTLKKLKDNGIVKNIIDLYNIDYNKVSNIKGLGEKSADIIKKAIYKKEYYDYEILGSLQMRNLSLESSKVICKNYTIPELINLYEHGYETLYKVIMDLEGFSSIQTKYFVNGFSDNIDTIKFLYERGCKTIKNEIKTNGKSLNIVFTGFRDKDFQSKLERLGHSVKSSVSGKTDLVITNDINSNTTKIKDAKSKGIEIISVQEAYNRFS